VFYRSMTLALQPLHPQQRDEAVRVLARAFVTNPLHVAAFGASQLARNEAFFRVGLAAMKGPMLAAVEAGRLLGVVHWVASPGCRYSGAEKLRMMPAMLHGMGVRPAVRVVSWVSAWARCDPDTPHVHLGPIGVDPAARGRHVGHLLMERYCAELAAARLPGYLETDRPENVGFYERFGFRVTSTRPVLGVQNFFMCRDA
jgi:ribosomal protein S18 acetylase RimI-like enzyme